MSIWALSRAYNCFHFCLKSHFYFFSLSESHFFSLSIFYFGASVHRRTPPAPIDGQARMLCHPIRAG